jgi:hypothetical protein
MPVRFLSDGWREAPHITRTAPKGSVLPGQVPDGASRSWRSLYSFLQKSRPRQLKYPSMNVREAHLALTNLGDVGI